MAITNEEGNELKEIKEQNKILDEIYSRDRYNFEYNEGFACIKESKSFINHLNAFQDKKIKIHLSNGNILSTKLKKIDLVNKCIITADEEMKQLSFNEWYKIVGSCLEAELF